MTTYGRKQRAVQNLRSVQQSRSPDTDESDVPEDEPKVYKTTEMTQDGDARKILRTARTPSTTTGAGGYAGLQQVALPSLQRTSARQRTACDPALVAAAPPEWSPLRLSQSNRRP